MSEWKCGDCGKEYSFEDFMKLNKTKAVDTDTNPKKQHGYVGVCECGYRFHRDKWMLKSEVRFKLNLIQEVVGELSTVFLDLNHFGYWYETMIFIRGKYQCHFHRRYVTRAEARAGHNKILRKIINQQFTVDKEKKEISISEDGERR